MLEHPDQCRVEAARDVVLGGRQELVVEAERVEEGLQPRIVVMAEARVVAEGVRHLGQRLAEMLRQHLLVRDVVRDLAQAIHVVGEADQPGRDLVLGQHAEGVAHEGGARDLAKGADMRQAAWPITGLEDDGAGRLRDALQPAKDFARLLERPSLAHMGVSEQPGVHFDLRLGAELSPVCRLWQVAGGYARFGLLLAAAFALAGARPWRCLGLASVLVGGEAIGQCGVG